MWRGPPGQAHRLDWTRTQSVPNLKHTRRLTQRLRPLIIVFGRIVTFGRDGRVRWFCSEGEKLGELSEASRPS